MTLFVQNYRIFPQSQIVIKGLANDYFRVCRCIHDFERTELDWYSSLFHDSPDFLRPIGRNQMRIFENWPDIKTVPRSV